MKILVVLALLYVSFSCLAGVDDSGLQVFSVTGDKILGQSTALTTTDTSYARTMNNLVKNETEWISATMCGKMISSEVSIYLNRYPNIIYDITTCNGNTFALWNPLGRNTDEIDLIQGTGVKIDCIPTNRKTTYIESFPYTIGGSNYTVLFTPRKVIKVSSTNTTSEVTVPFSTNADFASLKNFSTSAKMWNNRLFVSYWDETFKDYRIYYSSSTDNLDFTVGENKGGVIKCPGGLEIVSLVTSPSSLYIVTKTKVFYLTGAGSPLSWTLYETMQGNFDGNITHDSTNITYKNPKTACEYNGSAVIRDEFGTVFVVSGSSFQEIASKSQKSFTHIENDGKLYVGNMVWDLQGKYWYYIDYELFWNSVMLRYDDTQGNKIWMSIPNFKDWNPDDITTEGDTVTDGSFYTFGLKENSIAKPIQYISSFFSLDSNLSNFKEITRVEVDSRLQADITAKIRINFEYIDTAETVVLHDGTTIHRNDSLYPHYYYAEKTITGAKRGYYWGNWVEQTDVWNLRLSVPVRSVSFELYITGAGMKMPFALKGFRIYYRHVGNTLNNTLR